MERRIARGSSVFVKSATVNLDLCNQNTFNKLFLHTVPSSCLACSVRREDVHERRENAGPRTEPGRIASVSNPAAGDGAKNQAATQNADHRDGNLAGIEPGLAASRGSLLRASLSGGLPFADNKKRCLCLRQSSHLSPFKKHLSNGHGTPFDICSCLFAETLVGIAMAPYRSDRGASSECP
jgi:hypothetical protein